jgi:hypothetical protein
MKASVATLCFVLCVTTVAFGQQAGQSSSQTHKGRRIWIGVGLLAAGVLVLPITGVGNTCCGFDNAHIAGVGLVAAGGSLIWWGARDHQSGLLGALTALHTPTKLAAADLSGVWTLSWEPDFGGNFDAYDCTFKQTGRALAVTCREDLSMTGEVDGQKITVRFKAGRDGSQTATLTGEVDQRGTTITGTWHLSAPENRDGKFVARKQ